MNNHAPIFHRVAGLRRVRMVNAILILLLFSILVPLFIFLAFSSFKIEGHFYIMWASAVGLLIFPIMALSSIPRNGVYVIGDEDFAIHF